MLRRDKFETVTNDARHGGIWQRYFIDGVTRFSDALDSAEITVTRSPSTSPVISAWAMRHEVGHVLAADDMHANEGNPVETFRGYDGWQAEVEAWVRGADAEGSLFMASGGCFALDCLNTYRRSLNVSDADFEAARELLADMAATEQDAEAIMAHVPLEPEPNDPPPDCTGGSGSGFGSSPADPDSEPNEPEPDRSDEDESEPDEDADDDGEDEDEDEDEPDSEEGEGSGGEPGYSEGNEPGNFDMGWFEPAPFSAVEDGGDVAEIAARYGLDPTRVPPLLAAFVR